MSVYKFLFQFLKLYKMIKPYWMNTEHREHPMNRLNECLSQSRWETLEAHYFFCGLWTLTRLPLRFLSLKTSLLCHFNTFIPENDKREAQDLIILDFYLCILTSLGMILTMPISLCDHYIDLSTYAPW